MWKKVSPNFDTSAVEIWAAQQKQGNAEELKSYISLYYGPSAWESIVAIEAEQRKQQKEAVYRRQEKIDNLINWIVGIVIILVGFVLFGAIIYFIGKARGQW